MADGQPELALLSDVGFLLARSSGEAIRRTNAHLKPTGLRARQYSVLSVAIDTHGISQRELSDLLGLDPSLIVTLVDDLQSQGLVERRLDDRDRRNRLVAPTRRGRSLYKRARARVATAREEFLSHLDEGERTLLLTLLRRIILPEQSTEPGAKAG